MDTKELLKDFSTEDLANEIKRRKKEARAAVGRKKTVWHEWTGVVSKRFREYLPVCNIGYYINSDHVYKNRTFYLRQGIFNKKNMPKEGDTVVLAVKIVKADKGKIRYKDSKIIRIEKRHVDENK